ncbi:MAG TPA: ABC transporter permease, partial [Armatimonadota bacterium]
ITPAVSAGTITGEREQETLEPLLLTRLSTVNIVLGKLISSQSIVIVLMLCSLPFQVAAVMLGGVSPRCCSGR